MRERETEELAKLVVDNKVVKECNNNCGCPSCKRTKEEWKRYNTDWKVKELTKALTRDEQRKPKVTIGKRVSIV